MALPRMEASMAGLRGAGFTEDQIELVLRAAEGDPKRIPPLVEEIVSRQVDIILAIGSGMVQAFRPATKTIPIVALDFESDPVASGFVATLAQAGWQHQPVCF